MRSVTSAAAAGPRHTRRSAPAGSKRHAVTPARARREVSVARTTGIVTPCFDAQACSAAGSFVSRATPTTASSGRRVGSARRLASQGSGAPAGTVTTSVGTPTRPTGPSRPLGDSTGMSMVGRGPLACDAQRRSGSDRPCGAAFDTCSSWSMAGAVTRVVSPDRQRTSTDSTVSAPPRPKWRSGPGWVWNPCVGATSATWARPAARTVTSAPAAATPPSGRTRRKWRAGVSLRSTRMDWRLITTRSRSPSPSKSTGATARPSSVESSPSGAAASTKRGPTRTKRRSCW